MLDDRLTLHALDAHRFTLRVDVSSGGRGKRFVSGRRVVLVGRATLDGIRPMLVCRMVRRVVESSRSRLVRGRVPCEDNRTAVRGLCLVATASSNATLRNLVDHFATDFVVICERDVRTIRTDNVCGGPASETDYGGVRAVSVGYDCESGKDSDAAII